ncbi:MAG: hypothetical protein ACR2RV_22120 [Verrucomicrobiales bacterium]
MMKKLLCLLLSTPIVASLSIAEEAKPASLGALEFGPDGVLFAADPKGASVFALELGGGDAAGKAPVKIEKLGEKIAALLGAKADQISINDLAIDPKSAVAYLSVSRGLGADATPVLVKAAAGELSVVDLGKLEASRLPLSNAPENKVTGEGRRKKNKRLESITDLAWLDGRLAIAGLSNEEFASTLRVTDYPFTGAVGTTSLEIFHGAHGKEETHSPIRTFMPMDIGGEPNIIASYTCTPLVCIPLSKLKPETKVKGRTVAELGNRNRPLDMISYEKGGERFILMANSSRGVMKVSTKDIATIDSITQRVAGESAGLSYETVEAWDGVVQLAKVDDGHAAIIRSGDAGQSLEHVALP